MRSRLVAAAALATCMMVLGVPTANAWQDEDSSDPVMTTTTVEPTEEAEPTDEPQGSPIEVTLALNPAAAVPGQTVIATAACDGPDEAALTSPVLEPVVLTADPAGHQPWALSGSTTVRQDARPGDYQVSAACDGGPVSTTLTVLPAVGGTDETVDDGDQVDRVPTGAPETGGGPDSGSLAPLLAAAGLAGLAGFAGAGGVAVRRALQR